MMVKICGITNVADALAAADAGAQFIGLNFYSRSPRYIAPENAAEVVAALPAHAAAVGVFVNETPTRIAEIVSEARLQIVQLHGNETPEHGVAHPRVWKAFAVQPGFSEASMLAFPAEAYVLDAPAGALYGGSGATFDWSRVPSTRQRVILAGGLGPENVSQAIEQVRPWGVDACSRLELSPGRKDHRRMRQFIEAARSVLV